MTWRTFAGSNENLFLALLKVRCHKEGLDITDHVLHQQLRLHIHRGIGHLAGNQKIRSIAALIKTCIEGGFSRTET
jgi:DNA sulfur modification protein DndE